LDRAKLHATNHRGPIWIVILLEKENPNDDNNDDDSGRSTPEHLKKYSGSAAFNDNCNGTNSGSNSAQAAENSRRLRTFSETLKMLDDDILEELDVK